MKGRILLNITQKQKTILIILVIGTFLGFLNQTLMNVALPDIMREFHISTDLGQWMTNGYMLVNGVMVPLTAFLIQRLTTRTLYLSLIHISEPTRRHHVSRMPSSA